MLPWGAGAILNVALIAAIGFKFLPREWLPAALVPSSAPASEGQEDTIHNALLDRAEGAVFGAVLGDALALQTHYEYDYKRIRDFYKVNLDGSVERLAEELRPNAAVLGLAITPGLVGSGADMRNWHSGKGGGDLTDYGDCVVMALEFLASSEWSFPAFDRYWWEWIQAYKGYINMATKAVYQNRAAGRIRPNMLYGQPHEDLFAICRVPALIFAMRQGGRGADADLAVSAVRCEWGGEIERVLELQPARVSQPFPSERAAKQSCELMGVELCGGVVCWRSPRAHDRQACAIALPGAKEVTDGIHGVEEITSWKLTRCSAPNSTWQVMRAAMESASVQYATTSIFATAAYLAAVGRRLVHQVANNDNMRGVLDKALQDATEDLPARDARLMSSILYAVRMKVAEVEQNGTDWSPDPLEVDDIALQTFTKTSRGVEFVAFPCGAPDGECGYWGPSGKASPTLPALTATLYLALRYANRSLDHGLAVNAMLGGDNAARAVPLGMILGALHGRAAMPQRLVNQLNVKSHLSDLLKLL